jgi:hypothetical protein
MASKLLQIKNYIPVLCLVLASLKAEAQLIKGRVMDFETDQGVPHASIYFNNSLNGTTSDLDGHFKLDISQNLGQEIVVSCVGYSSETLLDYSEGKFFLIYLNPRSVLLPELLVESKDGTRKKKLKSFLKEFLGTTSNAKKCKILNLEYLQLVFHHSTNTLEAFADRPLIIENRALGYRITYFLKEFRHDGKRTYFEGNYVFEEDSSLSQKDRIKIERKRMRVYSGSRMHFMRALWNNQLEESDFIVKKRKNGESRSYHELVEQQFHGKKYLSAASPLIIYYLDESSYIAFKQKDEVLFTESGYLDPEGLIWEGSMAFQRMADALPFEYIP